MRLSAPARPAGGDPLGEEEFARLMALLGPFEPAPRLAAAVSGGADSLALAVLAAAWAKAVGGSVAALVVDHRLRPDSTAEARRAARLLRDRGIPVVILTRTGRAPQTGIEAAAREARYRLMGEWCGAHRVLHLLVGHNREDQAETVLLRLAAGSGLDGLAAMPAVQETRWGRLLRPLLSVPRDRLRSTLRERGVGWIEDPSNTDETFARVRLRRSAPILAVEGLDAARLSRTAGRLGEGRAALEAATAALLAACVWIHPAGFARLERDAIAAAPADQARRALERVIRTIGAGDYPPRRERLQKLFEVTRGTGSVRARTLGGCIVRAEGADLLVAREPAAIGADMPADPATEIFWDRRFRVRISDAAETGCGLRIAALGIPGWRTVRQAGPAAAARRIPPAARPGLPALWDRQGLLEVPHMGYVRGRGPLVDRLAFAPAQQLAAAEFSVV